MKKIIIAFMGLIWGAQASVSIQEGEGNARFWEQRVAEVYTLEIAEQYKRKLPEIKEPLQEEKDNPSFDLNSLRSETTGHLMGLRGVRGIAEEFKRLEELHGPNEEGGVHVDFWYIDLKRNFNDKRTFGAFKTSQSSLAIAINAANFSKERECYLDTFNRLNGLITAIIDNCIKRTEEHGKNPGTDSDWTPEVQEKALNVVREVYIAGAYLTVRALGIRKTIRV